MIKKRKVWWIAGGLGTAFALFVLAVYLADYNSTDARVERAVAQIADEYGFEQIQSERYGSPIETGGAVAYSGVFENADEPLDILATLRTVCEGYDYIHHFVADDGMSMADGELDAAEEWHVFATDDSQARELVVVFSIDIVDSGSPQTASLFMTWTNAHEGLRERINGLWPW